MGIDRIGKKGKEWIKDRAKLVKKAILTGRIQIINGQVQGKCKDCEHWHNLGPDHKRKRSQGGEHKAENIDWVCNEAPCWCHNERDNMGDPKNKKTKKSKAGWEVEHKCIGCKGITRQFICHLCRKKSII